MIFLALFLATTLTPGTAGAATERSADGQTRVLVTTVPLGLDGGPPTGPAWRWTS